MRVRGQLLIRSLLCDFAIGADANDAVRSFDGRKTMRNANRSVVLLKELAQSLVDKRLRFGIQRASSLIQDENVRLFDECSCNGYALLLSTR